MNKPVFNSYVLVTFPNLWALQGPNAVITCHRDRMNGSRAERREGGNRVNQTNPLPFVVRV